VNETNQSRGIQEGNSNIREDRDDEGAASSQRETQPTTLSEYLSDNLQVKLLLLRYKTSLLSIISLINIYFILILFYIIHTDT